ncbi:MalY/PatB family protein [uncultured Sphingobacterium sp.]|uniref:MalY/PatB family protein n=1 Tax=uncultured Sphingobacterium sp. TaxID=182688 RepID=UPI0037496675
MTYNFDEIISRKHTNSYKWDLDEDQNVLPMWVADMDFKTAPAVIDALAKRVQHGIFGYTKVPEAYYEAVVDWFEKRHRFRFKKEHLLYTSGVVPALSAIIKALTIPGNQVIVQSPVYNLFFTSIKNNGCEVVSNNLLYKNGNYHIDFEDLEEKAKNPNATMMLLCSPHNPAGRVWTKDELIRIGEICYRNNVIVVADEIHCDLVHPGHFHVPFASISEEFYQKSITCSSPSKAFNIAGLQIANILVSDDIYRQKIDKALNINEVCDVGVFGIEALIAAYTDGEDWLNQLNEYIFENYLCVKNYFAQHLPQFTLAPLEATYLVWIDCSTFGKPASEIVKTLLDTQNLRLNEGKIFGDMDDHFIRMNIACPRALLMEGLSRIKQVLEQN